MKKSEIAKSAAVVTAARPVRAPSRIPVADSMYAPLVDVPSRPLIMHATASTVIGRSSPGKFPFSSSIPPAAPTPTSVPSVSRKLMRKSVSRIGRNDSLRTPAMSRCSAIGASEYWPTNGRASAADGSVAPTMKIPAIAVTTMPMRIAPRTRR